LLLMYLNRFNSLLIILIAKSLVKVTD